MTNPTTPKPDVDTIRHFILAERTMRHAVFKRNPPQLAAKLTECDLALKALDHLAAQLAAGAQPRQLTLLDTQST